MHDGTNRRAYARRRTSILTLFFVMAPLLASADEDGVLTHLTRLSDEAVDNNPSIEAMRDRTRELGDLADVANVWPDPRVSVEYLNVPVDTFSIKDSPMAGVQFMLLQRLPEWGWTRAVREVAEHDVERSRHARAEAEVQLRRSVETLYWNLTLSRLLEGVTADHLARTLELIRAVRARYEVGRIGQNALLRLEVLRGRLEDDLGDFTRAERRISAGLARALARDAMERFDTPTEVQPIAPRGDVEQWLELARKHRPELAVIREEIQQQEKSAELARVSARPDVDVWVKYRVRAVDTVLDDGTDFFSAGISVPIPWGSRKRGRGREAASFAARDGARARLAAALDAIEAEVIEVDARWRRASRKAAHYQDSLIPAALASLETSLYDFSVGKAEFATLYEAEIDLLELERSYLSATVETHVQRAAACAVTGRRDLGGSSS